MGKLLGIANKKVSRAPMQIFDFAEINLKTGVQNDLRGTPGDRQVTVITREAWEDACKDLGADLPWTTRRVNLLIEGISLTQSIGSYLYIEDVILEITMESKPCSLMDEMSPGLREALIPEWRGGIRCKVIRGGEVKVGCPVRLEKLLIIHEMV